MTPAYRPTLAMAPPHARRGDSGFALVVVLVVLLVVASIATALVRHSKIQSLLSENEKSQEVAAAAARGWLAVVKARLHYDLLLNPAVTSFNGRAMAETVKSFTLDHSGVSIECEVVDEASKFDLRTLKNADKAKAKLAEERLRYLLLNYRDKELPDAERMIRSLTEHFARRSGEDVPLPEMEGEAPPILTVDELLQLEGWEKKFLFDLREEETEIEAQEAEEPEPLPGLFRFLTIYGDGKINVNTAPKEVLMVLFRTESDPSRVADEIIAYRQAPEESETPSTMGEDAPLFADLKAVSDLTKVPGIEASTLTKNGVDGETATVRSDFFSVHVYATRDEYTLQTRTVLHRHPLGFITKLSETRRDERFEKNVEEEEER